MSYTTHVISPDLLTTHLIVDPLLTRSLLKQCCTVLSSIYRAAY